MPVLMVTFAVAATCVLAAVSCCVASRHGIHLRFLRSIPLAVIAFGLGVQIIFLCRNTGVEGLIGALAIATVVIASVTDMQTGYIFDAVTATGIAGMLIFAAINDTLAASIAGASVVSACFAGLHLATRGRGIGLADAKLGACIGAAVGLQQGFFVIEGAFVLGGLYAALLLAMRRAHRKTEIRFAPYMAIALAGSLIGR